MKFLALAFAATASAAFAQSPVELKDTNAKYTMQLGGDIAWSVESDLTGEQSTIVAASPDGHEPFAVISAMTYLKVNSLALMGASIAEKTTDNFLKGLCENYKCADISERTYEEIGDHKAWVVTTQLELADYKNLGVPEALMIATVSPDGYMQLFSLHTAKGKSEAMKSILIDAVKTIQPAP
ncbi:hypothetical protein KO498_04625 [Lentibacter algarum]|uniref:hypothetical protein n=1 Tax=Lentibacter algarum TaxID=576131 RepID=UPI001C072C52|nr:hypothetical protein [Lentibacter algarum]MBU2981093.1 hypothetical protein [Lentibacter algarum]